MSRMHDDWERELARLMSRWDQITAEQRAELLDQVRAAAESGDLLALAELEIDTDNAEELLTEFMINMAAIGADQVVAEASAQGVEVEPEVPEGGVLAEIALVVVVLLAMGLALAVGREALRLMSPGGGAPPPPGGPPNPRREAPGHNPPTGPTPDEVVRKVDEFIRDLPDRALRDQLGGALTNAQNRGRFESMLRAPSAAWYASERNDPSACDPCRKIDNRRFDSLEQAMLAYPNGGYVGCEGGIRCRGGVVPIWDREE